MKDERNWTSVLKNYTLMQDAHYENDAQNWHIIGIELVSTVSGRHFFCRLLCLPLSPVLTVILLFSSIHDSRDGIWSTCVYTWSSPARRGSTFRWETSQCTPNVLITAIKLPHSCLLHAWTPQALPLTTRAARLVSMPSNPSCDRTCREWKSRPRTLLRTMMPTLRAQLPSIQPSSWAAQSTTIPRKFADLSYVLVLSEDKERAKQRLGRKSDTVRLF